MPHKMLVVDDDKARQCGNRREWELQPDWGTASQQPIAEFRVRVSDHSPHMSLLTASAVSPLHDLRWWFRAFGHRRLSAGKSVAPT